VSTADLEKKFEAAMFEIYERAKSEAGYRAAIFHRMLSDRGGLETAKYLINAKDQSDGYTALWEKRRLDLTVEAMVVEQQKWHSLFLPEEIEKARNRLEQNDYVIRHTGAGSTEKARNK